MSCAGQDGPFRDPDLHYNDRCVGAKVLLVNSALREHHNICPSIYYPMQVLLYCRQIIPFAGPSDTYPKYIQP